ncbi:MAG: transketolase [Holophagaceae bacterium]|nr:transketolase [Holophagaceae bacterium]
MESVAEMAAKAKAVRRDVLLQVYKAQSGHPGGSLSWTDIGVALYYHEMTVFPEDPTNPARDRFVLSKGHACPAQYAILADQGFFPKAWLETFRQYPGVIWEAAMAAPHHKLDNLCVFHDLNGLQIDGDVKKVMNINPVPDKWRAFGWAVKEIDGHDFTPDPGALAWARTVQGQPAMICARTVKGKGVSFMENNAGWHGVAPKTDEYEKALAELAD